MHKKANTQESKNRKYSLSFGLLFRNLSRSTLGGLLGFCGGWPSLNSGSKAFRLGVPELLSPSSFSCDPPDGLPAARAVFILWYLGEDEPDSSWMILLRKMFLAALIPFSSVFSSTFLGMPWDELDQWPVGFRAMLEKWLLAASAAQLLFSSLSFAALNECIFGLGPDSPFCRKIFLLEVSSLWETSWFREGFCARSGLETGGLGSFSCVADVNFSLTSVTFENAGFASLSCGAKFEFDFVPRGFFSFSWGAELRNLFPVGFGYRDFGSSFTKSLVLVGGLVHPAFPSFSLLVAWSWTPNLCATGFKYGGFGSFSALSSIEGLTPTGGLGWTGLWKVLGPEDEVAFPWLVNFSSAAFLVCNPVWIRCPGTLKGRLIPETSSVGLLPVLNFAMSDFTSALPSYKHEEEKKKEQQWESPCCNVHTYCTLKSFLVWGL